MASHARRASSGIGLLLVAACVAAGCSASGTTKTGGAPPATHGPSVTLTFATANNLPVDAAFAAALAKDSAGQIKLRPVMSYNPRAADVDVTIAHDLVAGKLDIGDVASRAWESTGATEFQAYQDPFLISTDELLDQASTGGVAADLLPTLSPEGLTGLAIVPTGIRYLYSTRPLTTPAQFRGARISINPSRTTAAVLRNLGATPIVPKDVGPAVDERLRNGTLTAVESNPGSALLNGYVRAAPYVLVDPPLFAKTTTLAANAHALSKLSAQQRGWVKEAATQAAASVSDPTADRTAWASQCGEGLKPLTATPAQRAALVAAEAPTYASISADPATALAVDRIGALAIRLPRMDSWATCHGVGLSPSATREIDGTYTNSITEQQLKAQGQDCLDCGNAGSYVLTIHDGMYVLAEPKVIDANPLESSVAFDAAWKRSDPAEIGSITTTGNHLAQVPWVNQVNGSTPATYTFELYRGELSFHPLTGEPWVTRTAWHAS